MKPSHPRLFPNSVFRYIVPAFTAAVLWHAGANEPPSVSFVVEIVDDSVEVGYGVAIGDVDGDGKPDILLADKREHVWYENPAWTRHVMARNLSLRDNVCIAAADITGDGQVEVAVGGQWNPGETSDPAQSGSVHFLIRPEDPTAAWRPVALFHDPTVHRMGWVRPSEGEWRLLVLPLHGIGNRDGAGEKGVRVRVHSPPVPDRTADSEAWSHTVIDDSLHSTHNFDDTVGEVLVGGAEGILRTRIENAEPGSSALLISPENSVPPTRGVGEVRLGTAGLIAAIEPMHGNEVVVYEPLAGNRWRRTTLDDTLNQGHALAVGDLLGLGHDQVIAGWRNPNADGKVGIRLYYRNSPDATEWQALTIDDDTMACEDLKLADLDGDGRLDIVASGRATHNLAIYWNRSGN